MEINVFISHSWNYTEHYETLRKWIFEENCGPVNFCDYSIPKDDPIHNARTSDELKDRIFAEIQKSDVVVIPTGVYVTYSKWIKKEIDGAKEYNRPILAVSLWGSDRKSSKVQSAADEMVGWKKDSVVEGICSLHAKLTVQKNTSAPY